jgi:hypothetical protein
MFIDSYGEWATNAVVTAKRCPEALTLFFQAVGRLFSSMGAFGTGTAVRGARAFQKQIGNTGSARSRATNIAISKTVEN